MDALTASRPVGKGGVGPEQIVGGDKEMLQPADSPGSGKNREPCGIFTGPVSEKIRTRHIPAHAGSFRSTPIIESLRSLVRSGLMMPGSCEPGRSSPPTARAPHPKGPVCAASTALGSAPGIEVRLRTVRKRRRSRVRVRGGCPRRESVSCFSDKTEFERRVPDPFSV